MSDVCVPQVPILLLILFSTPSFIHSHVDASVTFKCLFGAAYSAGSGDGKINAKLLLQGL